MRNSFRKPVHATTWLERNSALFSLRNPGTPPQWRLEIKDPHHRDRYGVRPRPVGARCERRRATGAAREDRPGPSDAELGRCILRPSMSERMLKRVESIVSAANAILRAREVLAGFDGTAPEPAEVLAALDELVRRGRLLRWNHDDGSAGWSDIFKAHTNHNGWTVVTAPVDEKALQDELLELDPFAFTEFIESVLSERRDLGKVGFAGSPLFDLLYTDTAGREHYLITKLLRTTDARTVNEVLGQREELRSKRPDSDVIMVVPGLLTTKARELATHHGLTVWDRAELLRIAPNEIVELWRAAARREATHDQGTRLLDQLADIRSGRDQWSEYQALVGHFCEYLFVPPLGVPALEVSNESGADRRDLVMANMAESGTWSLLRQLYRADYVVVDAKNHGEPLVKKSIIEVAHYLKWYGPGLFALVACRQGFAESGHIAAREQWIGSQRMIVAVTDEDFREMVRLKQQGSNPVDVLTENIRRFRLSL